MKLILLVVSALLAIAAADTTTTADVAVTTVSAEVQCAKACKYSLQYLADNQAPSLTPNLSR